MVNFALGPRNACSPLGGSHRLSGSRLRQVELKAHGDCGILGRWSPLVARKEPKSWLAGIIYLLQACLHFWSLRIEQYKASNVKPCFVCWGRNRALGLAAEVTRGSLHSKVGVWDLFLLFEDQFLELKILFRCETTPNQSNTNSNPASFSLDTFPLIFYKCRLGRDKKKWHGWKMTQLFKFATCHYFQGQALPLETVCFFNDP